MDQTSLTKPVDLQGLSLALAQTKSDYLTKIDQLANECQPDWEVEENDGMPNAYIRNKPAIRAGEGENSVVEGQIEDDADAAVYTIYITGDANATVFTYTTEDALPSTLAFNGFAYYAEGSNTKNRYLKIKNIDINNSTIEFYFSISSSAISNKTLLFYYKSKNYALARYSYARGRNVIAAGTESCADGNSVIASGNFSHAEGNLTYAASATTHAEGYQTKAYAMSAHAEGYYSEASGSYSHAEGQSTIAVGNSQHAQGKYNIEDTTNTYAHIVGNGISSSARSNAHTLDWSGNSWYAGKVSAGTVASPANPTAANDLTTKQYVDTAISGITDNNTTYTLSMSGNVITITGSDSSTSSITLPIYNGSVSAGGGA